MELSELHDCEKCHGKIVSIAVDKLGNEYCGYCGERVDYKRWFDKHHPEFKQFLKGEINFEELQRIRNS